ncbi:MAG: hypothetical protein ACPF9D_02500, partial [Owenweeksia sp.]
MACDRNNIEYERVKRQNVVLTSKVDSLQGLLDKFEVVTDLNNHDFNIKVGEEYIVESMALLKNGLVLDSLLINNKHIMDNTSVFQTKQGFFGPVIKITPREKGNYNIEAYVSSFAWGDQRVKTEWTLFVED